MNGNLLSTILHPLSSSLLSQPETGQILPTLCVTFFPLKTCILFHSVEMKETSATGYVDLAVLLSTHGQNKCNLSWKCTTAWGCFIYVTALGNQTTRNNTNFAEEVLQACSSCNSQPVQWNGAPEGFLPSHTVLNIETWTCLGRFSPLCAWAFSSYGDFSPPWRERQ